MRKLLILILFFTVIVWAGSIDKTLKYAMALSDSGKYDEAIVKFEEVLKSKPKHATANFAIGQTYLKKRNCETALKYLNNALNFGYDPLKGHMALAKAYKACGMNVESRMEYRLAIDIKPDDPALHTELGSACLEEGSFRMAEEEFNKALELGPSYIPAMLGLAKFHQSKKQYSQADSLYEKALKINSKYAPTYIGRSNLYADQKMYDKAIAELNKYLQLVPKDPKAYAALAEVHVRMKDYPGVIVDLRQAVDYGDTTISSLKLLAYSYMQTKQPYETKEALKGVLAREPYNVVGWIDLARTYSKIDSAPAAAATYNRALSIDSLQLSRIAFEFGLTYYQLAKYDSAVVMFSDKIRFDSLAPGAYINRALAYMQLKKYKPEVIDDLKKGLEIKPDHIQARVWLAQTYLFLIMKKEAKAEAKKVLELDPKNKEAKEILENLTTTPKPTHEDYSDYVDDYDYGTDTLYGRDSF